MRIELAKIIGNKDSGDRAEYGFHVVIRTKGNEEKIISEDKEEP